MIIQKSFLAAQETFRSHYMGHIKVGYNSHFFTQQSRHHNPEDPCNPDEKNLVNSGSFFLAIFLLVLKHKC